MLRFVIEINQRTDAEVFLAFHISPGALHAGLHCIADDSSFTLVGGGQSRWQGELEWVAVLAGSQSEELVWLWVDGWQERGTGVCPAWPELAFFPF